jgi:multidrug efflux pump subunit AcrB
VSNSSLWTPMGVVICFGTVVAMILVVTILPVVYWKIYGSK